MAVPDDLRCPREAIGNKAPNHTRVLEFAELARVFRGEMKRSKGKFSGLIEIGRCVFCLQLDEFSDWTCM